MSSRNWIAGLVAALAFALPAGAASDRATPDEARAIVKKGIQHYKKMGRDKAMADFSRAEGGFVDRDLYVVVIRMDGIELAHINPKSVGKNMLDLRDPDGKYLIRERLEASK